MAGLVSCCVEYFILRMVPYGRTSILLCGIFWAVWMSCSVFSLSFFIAAYMLSTMKSKTNILNWNSVGLEKVSVVCKNHFFASEIRSVVSRNLIIKKTYALKTPCVVSVCTITSSLASLASPSMKWWLLVLHHCSPHPKTHLKHCLTQWRWPMTLIL